MKINFDSRIKKLASLFPVPLYAVGGFVRDSLIGLAPYDLDISSSLSPNEVKKILEGTDFHVSDGSKKLLTLVIKCGEEHYEYTSFRKDSYANGHRPTSVVPCTDIETDAKRRDFTVNAIYYDIKNDCLVDPLNGLCDLENKRLVTTRSPREVFSEDGLRLMRLARFSSSLGFAPTEEVIYAGKENRFLIDEISKERVRDEFDKILVADKYCGIEYAHVRGLEILDEIGVLERVFPDVCLGKGMAQRSDYHAYDVFGHIMQTVKFAAPEVRLSALMHDVAKPKMMRETGRYVGHDVVGGVLARQILADLKYPNAVVERTARLVENHMFNLKNDAKISTIRRFILKNADILDDLVMLKYADYYGSGRATEPSLPSADALKIEYEKMKEEGVPFSLKELLINGNDLSDVENLPPCKRGEALNALLLQCVLPDSSLTTKEKQLDFIKNYAGRK